mgnify:CR=1 FL=1
MWKYLPALAALSLGGCVSLPADYAGAGYDSAELTRQASLQVETLVFSVGPGGAPDFAAAQLAIERARMAVVARISMGIGSLGLEQYAGLGALGATLTLCQDGVARLQALHAADPDSAMVQARTRFWPGCAMPLGLAALQVSGQPAAMNPAVAAHAPAAGAS